MLVCVIFIFIILLADLMWVIVNSLSLHPNDLSPASPHDITDKRETPEWKAKGTPKETKEPKLHERTIHGLVPDHGAGVVVSPVRSNTEP